MVSNDAKETIRKGDASYNLKNYEEALNSYDKAIEILPDYPDAWIRKGNVFYHLQKYDEALECYDKAIQIDPKNAHAFVRKGNVFYHFKKYDEALECYDKAIQIDPKNTEALVGKAVAIDDKSSSKYFRSAPSSKYFSMVEEFVYQHDYLAMLIIVGGYVRQKMVNELTIEKILEKDNHLYLLQGFNQFVREILITMNKYSKDNQRTLALSSRIQTAFKTCKTLVS
jgi:tetratricopeptide (TPR) repeat protein